MREPNAIDFWRGVALVTIFVNHIPGALYQQVTYSQYSISDAAELFVFLAGWAIALATARRGDPDSPRRVVLRLASRTLEIYRAQILVTAIALAMIAGAAIVLDNPLIIEWHNAGPVFVDPVPTTLGWVLMTHQLGYFNILPLYVAILALSPFFVLLARYSRAAALIMSANLYLAAMIYEINVPSWPVEGHWFFNPLSWQLLLVLGFVASDLSRSSERFWTWAGRLQPVGIAGVALGVVVMVTGWRPDPLMVPEPRLLFLFDKTYLSPARILHFVCLLLAFQGVFGWIARLSPWLAGQASALGRNSLEVFVVASLASLAAQFVRFVTGGGFIVDTLVVWSGLCALSFTAWFVEWRSRSPRPSSLRE
ncbi:OpgC family protein [Salinarimonas soli]|uniref:OpgC domain-containing protein n=1 Tax=Salinarimonas soli TaxID=1638099 RepID=A0A5B2VDA5_9HYPH|nr:OpgC domain-containing protein [Salinarimonas soli]KAA2236745.1 OpgC domain-containing protein [Salinarimonas soli]